MSTYTPEELVERYKSGEFSLPQCKQYFGAYLLEVKEEDDV